jgi:hypothetical protein
MRDIVGRIKQIVVAPTIQANLLLLGDCSLTRSIAEEGRQHVLKYLYRNCVINDSLPDS